MFSYQFAALCFYWACKNTEIDQLLMCIQKQQCANMYPSSVWTQDEELSLLYTISVMQVSIDRWITVKDYTLHMTVWWEQFSNFIHWPETY